MPSITIDVSVDNEYKPDDDSWLDWVVFAGLCSATLFLASGCISLLYLRRGYDPLRYKSTGKIIWMSLFGVIHMWSTFIGNQHLDIFEATQMLHCAFWGYWAQYCIGLCGWFVVLIRRIMLYGRVFHHQWRDTSMKVVKRLELLVVVSMILPIFSICIAVTSSDGSKFDPEIETCHSSLIWKLLVVLWIIECSTLFILANRSVLRQMHKSKRYLNEYTPFNQIVWAGMFAIIAKAPIHFLGITGHVYGRFIDTSVVIFLHVFCYNRLIGYTQWMAFTKDKNYASLFREQIITMFPEMTSVIELLRITEIEKDFLEYCRTQSPFTTVLGNRRVTVQPVNMAESYWRMKSWRLSESCDKSEAASILREFLHQDGAKYNSCPQMLYVNMITTLTRVKLPNDMFAEAMAELIVALDDRFGGGYLDSKVMDRIISNGDAARLINDHSYSKMTSEEPPRRGVQLDDDDTDDGSVEMREPSPAPKRGTNGEYSFSSDDIEEDFASDLTLSEHTTGHRTKASISAFFRNFF